MIQDTQWSAEWIILRKSPVPVIADEDSCDEALVSLTRLNSTPVFSWNVVESHDWWLPSGAAALGHHTAGSVPQRSIFCSPSQTSLQHRDQIQISCRQTSHQPCGIVGICSWCSQMLLQQLNRLMLFWQQSAVWETNKLTLNHRFISSSQKQCMSEWKQLTVSDVQEKLREETVIFWDSDYNRIFSRIIHIQFSDKHT